MNYFALSAVLEVNGQKDTELATALYIPTHDLRIHDNPCLTRVAQFDTACIALIYDPRWFKPTRYQTKSIGPKRWTFTVQAIEGFYTACEGLGNKPVLRTGEFVAAVNRLVQESGAQTLIMSRPIGWYECEQLIAIRAANPALQIEMFDTYTLFSEGTHAWLAEKLPRQYTPFRRLAEQADTAAPIAAVESLPPSTLQSEDEWSFAAQDVSSLDFIGTEQAGLEHLKQYLHCGAASHYKETRNALSGWSNSSKLSLWLASGSLSVRYVWQSIAEYERTHGANESTQWLYVELLWREYFQWLARKLGTQLYRFQGIAKRQPLTSFYAHRFRAWCSGTTGEPLVDAIMHELAQTGYISNRSRQIAASYCVNELQLDWRYGAAWFEQELVDYDVASNWGNWQYIAGVGVDPRGGRHFDIEKQVAQFDPEGDYVRHWLGSELTKSVALDVVDAADWPLAR